MLLGELKIEEKGKEEQLYGFPWGSSLRHCKRGVSPTAEQFPSPEIKGNKFARHLPGTKVIPHSWTY